MLLAQMTQSSCKVLASCYFRLIFLGWIFFVIFWIFSPDFFLFFLFFQKARILTDKFLTIFNNVKNQGFPFNLKENLDF